MKKLIKKQKIVILFIAAHLIMLTMYILMPNITDGVSVQMFDLTMFRGFDLIHAQTFVSELSASGKSYYLFMQIPLDFIYPLLVSTFFYLFFLDQIGNKKIASLGYASMLFDYLENIFVVIILTTANLTQTLVAFASAATIIKACFYVINYGLTLYLLARCRYLKGCPIRSLIEKKKNNN